MLIGFRFLKLNPLRENLLLQSREKYLEYFILDEVKYSFVWQGFSYQKLNIESVKGRHFIRKI